jgi:hypothetical protein
MALRLLRRAFLIGATVACVAAPAAIASGSSGQVWVNNCVKEHYKPTEIVLACGDGNTLLEKLHWSSWSASKAAGSGTYSVNDCTPTCVAGHFVNYPVTVTLSKPRACTGQKHRVFSHAAIATSTKDAKYLTKSWALTCPV